MKPTDRSAALRRDRFRVACWLAGFLALVPLPPLFAQPSDSSQLNWGRRDQNVVTQTPLQQTPLQQTTVQHNLTLAAPVPVSPSGVRTASQAESPAVLRWRTPGVSRAKASENRSDPPIKMITAAPFKPAPFKPAPFKPAPSKPAPVRPAGLPTLVTESEIPFRIPAAGDASWDREAGPTREPRELPKMDVRHDRLIQLVAQNQEIPDDIVPDEDSASPDVTPSNEPRESDLLPPASQEPLPPPRPWVDDAADEQEACNRSYNERNCCDDEKRCSDARQQWQRDALVKISLDITPQLRPDELDPYKEESLRNADLAQSPVREWRNRQGTVVTTGRLNNIQRGRLLVLDENNQIVKIPFRDLSDDDLCFATAWWRVPNECTFGDEAYLARNWIPSTLTWKATGVCHKPLYFEEPQLERYGHTTGHVVQPFLSGAHFFMNVVTLPYHAGINPPWECQYPLGYYRPGSCAPWLVPPVPLSLRGALWEAGVIAGGVAIIP